MKTSNQDRPLKAAARTNLLDLFRESSSSSAVFLHYDNGYRSWKYTYKQVALAAGHFARQLSEAGIQQGDKVIFWSENRPEWVAAFWGCVKIGAVVVPIDYRTSQSFLLHVHQIVAARLILIGEEVLMVPWESQPLVWRLADLEWTTREEEVPRIAIDENDVVEIVFTSGATGVPKGVQITHRNILANNVSPARLISTYRKWFLPFFPIRFLSLIPLSHMFGQAVNMFVVPLIPGTTVFMHGYSPHEIVRQIRTRRVSVLVAVPKILEVLQKHILLQFPETAESGPVESNWILRWWRYRRLHRFLGWKFWAFVVGAAPLSKELEEFWSRLGFAIVQGYGLTETAPIVAFNSPFDTVKGTVGKPIEGMEVKIAPDGEILVRGNSVTPGYYQAAKETAAAFDEGWFRTGDIGRLDDAGNLTILGRKKEMIVTPEGLKVFPQDVEDVLNRIPGVRESAAVGQDHVHAVLVLQDEMDPNEVIRQANEQLEPHQRIQSVSVWPGDRLPRTESTKKIKHGEIQAWVETGRVAAPAVKEGNVADLLRKYVPDRAITPETTLDQLGLSSLDRVELLLDLEEQFDISIDESLLTGARSVAALQEIGSPIAPSVFPTWNRTWLARAVRRLLLPTVFLPFARAFAHVHIVGREHLARLLGPVIFAPNHQSHLDTPLILSALPACYRYRVAAAMWKEYFEAYFSPERYKCSERFRDRLVYTLVTLLFNAFPIPQTEAGVRQTLRYIGDLVDNNWSILFFPEGERTETGEIHRFQPGIGLIATRLRVPVVPIRLRGVEKVLHKNVHWPHAGPVQISFGPPLYLQGEDYAGLAKQVEDAVLAL